MSWEEHAKEAFKSFKFEVGQEVNVKTMFKMRLSSTIILGRAVEEDANGNLGHVYYIRGEQFRALPFFEVELEAVE